ncbi:MAG: hypothetical protein WAP35_09765, partial [Solirubrobacterales bacterium]
MTSINYTQPISISSPSGDIDSVEFGAINVPRASTVQLRSSPQWENSSANNDIAGGWCVSTDVYGTWGATNGNCDDFRINEVGFMPNSASTRDGKTFIEIKGNGAVTPTSTLLAGWRVRVKPQGGPGEIFLSLPANANTSSQGLLVIADSDSSGGTQVPLYSFASAAVASGPSSFATDLEQYLRADRPITVQLLPPGGDPYSCTGAAVDTLGFIPVMSISSMTAGSDVCGPNFLINAFKPVTGYASGVAGIPDDSVQRSNEREFTGENLLDYCALPATPLQDNDRCNANQ